MTQVALDEPVNLGQDGGQTTDVVALMPGTLSRADCSLNRQLLYLDEDDIRFVRLLHAERLWLSGHANVNARENTLNTE